MTTGYELLAKVIKEDIAPAIREGFQALSDVLDAKAEQIKFTASDDRLEWYKKGVEDAQGLSAAPQENKTTEDVVKQATEVLFSRWDDGRTTKETFEGDAQALADAGLLKDALPDSMYRERTFGASDEVNTPPPMTVGQLTAEHIGKRIRVDQGWYGDFDGKLVMVEHRTAGTNTGLTRLSAAEVLPRSYRSDAPCEVFDAFCPDRAAGGA